MTLFQPALFQAPAPPMPLLSPFDKIFVNTSSGKDSQAMTDYVCEAAEGEGVLSRVVSIHADLGEMEWPGTKELAQKQAARYGIPFVVVRREQGNLLSQIEQRGMFPGPRTRFCTAGHKTGPIRRVFTQEADKHREAHGPDSRIRILNCMGMRAEESPGRAKRKPLALNEEASNGRRMVWDWLPLHTWSEDDVWARIRASRTADLVHPCYAAGMPRCSCVFCIFAGRDALIRAGHLALNLLAQYAAVEARIGHKFRVDLSMADVAAAVARGEMPKEVKTWAM